MLITLIFLLKYKAILAIDAVNFIPKQTHSGLGQLLTLIGYSSEWPEISETIRIEKE